MIRWHSGTVWRIVVCIYIQVIREMLCLYILCVKDLIRWDCTTVCTVHFEKSLILPSYPWHTLSPFYILKVRNKAHTWCMFSWITNSPVKIPKPGSCVISSIYYSFLIFTHNSLPFLLHFSLQLSILLIMCLCSQKQDYMLWSKRCFVIYSEHELEHNSA